jgi:predicted SAM-dependent methyltransferase
MMSRTAKDAFYKLAGPFMYVSGKAYELFKSPASNNADAIKVHLGPGQKNYMEGWINVDANIFSGKADVWADLRNPLPFKDESVDIFYSHHVIEHLPDLPFHFAEMYRCLKKGGKIRVGGPNGDSAIKKFMENDLAWFTDFPDKRTSIGGKFENFVFVRQEHLTILTSSYLNEIATNVGFSDFHVRLPIRETGFPEYIDEQVTSKEWEKDFETPETLLIEAVK